MTTTEFLTRFDNEEAFTEDELHSLFYGDFDDYKNAVLVDEEKGENRRWSYTCCKIYKINDRFFSFSGDIGLTEYQEDEFWDRPVEVEPYQQVKIITEWRVIKE